ncbi:hypothetical protein EG329_000787 [Mollisiaceae sp. DMI_Dod_QoI]|nr:hypothetical protein EG329_000787 [Helotiales sp. DMI_Dod_QoI]
MSQTTVETPSQPPWPKDVTARMTYEGPPNPGSGTAAASAIKEANLQVVSITDIRSTLDVQVPGYTLDSHGVTTYPEFVAIRSWVNWFEKETEQGPAKKPHIDFGQDGARATLRNWGHGIADYAADIIKAEEEAEEKAGEVTDNQTGRRGDVWDVETVEVN